MLDLLIPGCIQRLRVDASTSSDSLLLAHKDISLIFYPVKVLLKEIIIELCVVCLSEKLLFEAVAAVIYMQGRTDPARKLMRQYGVDAIVIGRCVTRYINGLLAGTVRCGKKILL